MTKTKAMPANKVVTGEVRFSYAHVWEPDSINGSDPKYSVSILIPKSDTKTINMINKAIEAAKEMGKVRSLAARFQPTSSCRCAMEMRTAQTTRCIRGITSSTPTARPSQASWTKTASPSRTARSFTAAAMATPPSPFILSAPTGNRGIACGLNNLMKTADGDPLGGQLQSRG